MVQSQRDVRNRIGAVKNIQKITRAMAMVATARLRRAEQRIEALRPYASAIRRMTRQAAEAAGPVPACRSSRSTPRFAPSACSWSPVSAASGRCIQLQHHSGQDRRRPAQGRQPSGRRRLRRRMRVVADVPRPGASRQLHRLHRPSRLHRRPTDRRPARGRLSRRRGRTGGGVLQRLPLADIAGGSARRYCCLQQATVLGEEETEEAAASGGRRAAPCRKYEPDPETVLRRPFLLARRDPRFTGPCSSPPRPSTAPG